VSDYVAQVMAGFRNVSRTVDLSIFTGWVSGRWVSFSRCCSAETYVKGPDYYAGIPSCTCCDRTLGPSDLRNEWMPPRKMDPNSTMDCPHPMEPEVQ